MRLLGCSLFVMIFSFDLSLGFDPVINADNDDFKDLSYERLKKLEDPFFKDRRAKSKSKLKSIRGPKSSSDDYFQRQDIKRSAERTFSPGSQTIDRDDGSSLEAAQKSYKQRSKGKGLNSNDLFDILDDWIEDLLFTDGKLGTERHSKEDKAQEEDDKRLVEDKNRLSRYKISRKYASPVESILEKYNRKDVDYYEVLGVSPSVDSAQLKKAYRAMALTIHPDKNPHPDTKLAFDAVQVAYETVSDGHKRKQYDRERTIRLKTTLLTPHKLQRTVNSQLIHFKRRVNLFINNIQSGKWHTEYTKIRNYISVLVVSYVTSAKHFLQHLLLLPTNKDRLQLVGEKLSKFIPQVVFQKVAALLHDLRIYFAYLKTVYDEGVRVGYEKAKRAYP